MGGGMFELDLGKFGAIENETRQAATLARQRGIPQAAETGGQADPDMRRFYTPELSKMQLVQAGSGGTACGYLTTVMGPVAFEHGTPVILKNSNASMYGHTFVEPTADGFIKQVPQSISSSGGGFSCGFSTETKPYLNPTTGEPLPAPNWPVAGAACLGGRQPIYP